MVRVERTESKHLPIAPIFTFLLSFLFWCAAPTTSASVGVVSVKSNPPGAAVRIFREGRMVHKGVTPVYVKRIPTGMNTVCVELDGHESHSKEVNVNTYKSQRVFAKLPPLSGANPVDCDAYDDGIQESVRQARIPTKAKYGKCQYTDASYYGEDQSMCFSTLNNLKDFHMNFMSEVMNEETNRYRGSVRSLSRRTTKTLEEEQIKQRRIIALYRLDKIMDRRDAATGIDMQREKLYKGDMFYIPNYTLIKVIDKRKITTFTSVPVYKVVLPDRSTCWTYRDYLKTCK